MWKIGNILDKYSHLAEEIPGQGIKGATDLL